MTLQDLENLIEIALADGVISQAEYRVLLQRAHDIGVSPRQLQQIITDVQARQRSAFTTSKQPGLSSAPAPPPSALYPAGGGYAASAGAYRQVAPEPVPQPAPQRKVNKCPACGEILPSFSSVCPKCGSELATSVYNPHTDTNIDLLNRLAAAARLKDRINIIKFSVVPSTKSALLDNLSLCLGQIEGASGSQTGVRSQRSLRYAWYGKLCEALAKSDILFRNDPDGRAIATNVKNKAARIMKLTSRNYIIFAILLPIVLFVLFVVFMECDIDAVGTLFLILFVVSLFTNTTARFIKM